MTQQNTYRRVPWDTFLHCTLGGFAANTAERRVCGRPFCMFTDYERKLLRAYAKGPRGEAGRLKALAERMGRPRGSIAVVVGKLRKGFEWKQGADHGQH